MREAKGAIAESLVGSSSTRKCTIIFGENGGKLDRGQGRELLNPCARESKSQTGRFLRENLISDHGLVFPYEGQQAAANGQDSWATLSFSSDTQGSGRLDAGSRAGFTSSRPPPSWILVLQFSYFCTMYGLEKLGLAYPN